MLIFVSVARASRATGRPFLASHRPALISHTPSPWHPALDKINLRAALMTLFRTLFHLGSGRVPADRV
jgi:hypothetical protein